MKTHRPQRQVALLAPRRLAITIAAGVAAVSVLGVVGGASALEAITRPVAGTWASTTRVTGDACQSPVALCTAGAMRGVINGTYTFSGTSLIQTADTPQTGVVFITGDLIVTTQHGQFTCKEALAFSTTAGGPVVSLCTFVSGTGDYAGVTGELQFVGRGTALTGGGGGDYVGALVYP